MCAMWLGLKLHDVRHNHCHIYTSLQSNIHQHQPTFSFMQNNNPVAPLPIPPSYLILHKLKEWDDCRTRALNIPGLSNQSTKVVHNELITMLRTLRYSVPPFNHDPTYDPKLHNESAPRVDRFLAAHNIYGKEWQQMGFRRTSTLRVNVSSTSRSAVPEGSKEKPIRPRWKDLSPMQIRSLAAQTTVAILTELGLPCAIFGSMACKLYGNRRIPNVRSISVLKVHTHHL